MNLNKRDMLIYKRFLEQNECDFGDELLDKYMKISAMFTYNNYTSDSYKEVEEKLEKRSVK